MNSARAMLLPVPDPDSVGVADTLPDRVPQPAPNPGSPAVMPDIEPRPMLPRLRVDAFVGTADLAAVLDCVARDRRAARSDFTIAAGGFAEAIDHYGTHAPGDLVLIEDTGQGDDFDRWIDALAECCPPSTRLLVVGPRNDIGLYRRLIRLGVSDYLVHPVEPLTLLDSITTIFMEETDSRSLGLVVAFLGARGGVGSSTVAHNAAALLGRDFDATTLLIDADIGFGTGALQFDVSSPHGLAEALKEREDLNPEVLERLISWRSKRFGILTAPDRADQIAVPDPGMMRHVIDQARRLAKYVVLDLSQGWAPWTAEAVAAADRVVLVATPDLPSLRNARTLLDLIEKVRPNDEPTHLVLNRMPNRGRPTVPAEDFVRILDRKMAATLPQDDGAAAAEMAGRVLCDAAPGSEFARMIGTLAARLAGREPVARRKPAGKSLLRRLLSRGRT